MPFVYEVSKLWSGIFDIWNKFAPKIYQQVKRIGLRMHQGGQILSRVPTNMSQNNVPAQESGKQLAPRKAESGSGARI